MSLHDIKFLSIWEVAHRWEGVDPDEESSGGPPAKVRERLRSLTQAVTQGLRCFDVHGEDLRAEAGSFDARRKTRFGKQLDKAVQDPVGHRKLLKTVFLFRYWFEGWYLGREVLPKFWFPRWIVKSSKERLKGGKASSASPPKLHVDRRDRATSQKIEEKTLSSVARKAAQKRHEPLNQLKQEFFDSYSRDKCRSRADAAGRFYKSLPPEKKKLLVESNAVRTLTEALGKHLKAINKH